MLKEIKLHLFLSIFQRNWLKFQFSMEGLCCYYFPIVWWSRWFILLDIQLIRIYTSAIDRELGQLSDRFLLGSLSLLPRTRDPFEICSFSPSTSYSFSLSYRYPHSIHVDYLHVMWRRSPWFRVLGKHPRLCGIKAKASATDLQYR